nr:immunoglobulin heavy chain junction region [Mus musculus]MBK4184545.1 immunoglobulin heavy chain junction region [Mus musculus]MBK4184547.1 immunoglobulin heavy chain junction region [Mus musculus]
CASHGYYWYFDVW